MGIYLLLGSNLGDRLKNLSDAKAGIGSVIKESPIYITAAWGKEDQPEFYNQAIQVQTRLSPEELLRKVLAIESEMGRIRKERWGERLIDIDILFYNDAVIDKDFLRVPHPEIQNRRFALAPLNDIAPSMLHPTINKTIGQLLEECPDPLPATRLLHRP